MSVRDLHIFRTGAEDWEVDTCEPLKKASREGDLTYEAIGHGPYPGEKFPEGVMTSVRNVGFWDSVKEQDWGLDWHRNEGIEFTFVSNGSVAFETANLSRQLDAGWLAITPPWVKHKLGDPTIGPSKLFWIVLDVKVRRPNDEWRWPEWVLLGEEELARIESMIYTNDFMIPVSRELQASVEAIQGLVERKEVVKKVAQLKVAMNQLLIDLVECDEMDLCELAENNQESQISKTVDIFLEELSNFLRIAWTVDSMAFECGMGKTVFTKAVKQKTNKTPMQHLNEVRLVRAAEMLSEGGVLVREVSEALGYRSSEYFSKCFRKRFGVSPREYAG